MHFRVAEPERARFLQTIRSVTAREVGSGLRLLPPVELTYPRGLVQAATLMNYAQIPAFIPDYRHVLWPERYHNRMGLFCFLFPGYPNQDYPFGWRACDEDLDPPSALVTILEPRLKAQVLPLYRIGYAAAPGKPFSNHLKQASLRYGWPVVAQTDNAAFVRTDVAALPGVAHLARGDTSGDSLVIHVEPERRRRTHRGAGRAPPGAAGPADSPRRPSRSRMAAAAATGRPTRWSFRQASIGSSCRPSNRVPIPKPTTCISPRS